MSSQWQLDESDGATRERAPIDGLRLNLGSGQNPKPGYLNVDKVGRPDVLWDLEQFPWPWEDSSVAEVRLSNVLEHLGATADVYFGIIRELYRICRDGAVVDIKVPHPRHDDFLNDPTHVRVVTPEGMTLFSKRFNRLCAERNAPNTPLALHLDVDFELEHVELHFDEPWESRYRAGLVSVELLSEHVRQLNNVVKGIHMQLRVVKAPPA